MESLLSTTPEQDAAAAKSQAKELFQRHGVGNSVRDVVKEQPEKGDEDRAESQADGVGALIKTLRGESPVEQEKTETPKAEAEGEPEAKAEGEKQSESPKVSDDADKTRRYLTLKGLPASALEAMSPEELAATRASHLEIDHQRAKALEEAAELRAELERQKTETAKEAEPKLPAATVDLDAQLQTLVDDGEISESVAKTLAEGMKARDQAILDQVQERLAPFEEQAKTAKAAGKAEVDRMKQSVRADLGERFPGLVEPESWAAVEENLPLLAGKAKYEELFAAEGLEPTVRAMIEASARMEGMKEIDVGQESELKKRRRADRDGGQPSTSQAKTSGPASGGSGDRAKFGQILRKHGLGR